MRLPPRVSHRASEQQPGGRGMCALSLARAGARPGARGHGAVALGRGGARARSAGAAPPQAPRPAQHFQAGVDALKAAVRRRGCAPRAHAARNANAPTGEGGGGGAAAPLVALRGRRPRRVAAVSRRRAGLVFICQIEKPVDIMYLMRVIKNSSSAGGAGGGPRC
ncbi:MAG: hypothetical protein J3K34DRAFT_214597 [Monoraphidium minutum]|nr:MAG: hypothetical protein J3K34DRAFT_214597 [Monoraphidium minutum]